MSFSTDLDGINTLFIDTAPVIYYIEAHPRFGPLAKEAFDRLQSRRLKAFSSVITIAEVLPKPVQAGDEELASKFGQFLVHGRNISLIDISVGIADRAGRLRGRYPSLRTVDAIQISAALEAGTDAFLTNDKKLKQIKDIRVFILEDYLQ